MTRFISFCEGLVRLPGKMSAMNPEVEALVRAGMSKARSPVGGDRVYKEECVYSFDNPEIETGLYVSLASFWGLGRDFVERYADKTKETLFLHIRRIRTKIPKPKIDGPEKKVTRFAIGVEGGFDANAGDFDVKTEEFYQLVVIPGFHTISLPCDSLPEIVTLSINGILAADSATKLADLEAMSGTWDGEIRRVSQYAASLVQVNNGKKIPPTGWKCEVEGCNMTENLWLNLTDGAIMCGRRFFDGSGGNNHAIENYQKTKYPLAVKLGTITADGRADVFSYAEDDMVEDPLLVQHLAHFGINITQMQKTDKSMAEMEIDLNQKLGEWSTLQEAGTKLKPLYGAGFTGFINLGNSCYMNSIMQVLFNISAFQNRFYKKAPQYFESAGDPANDFNVQMSKVCLGLASGKYSIPPPLTQRDDGTLEAPTVMVQEGINASMFRTLIGKGHPEFSTKRQQDAQEFLLHLINVMERYSRFEANPADCLKFQVEDKVICDSTGQVRYSFRVEYCLPLPIPLEAAINKDEVAAYELKKAQVESEGKRLPADELIRPKIPIEACLQSFIASEKLDPFYSSATKRIGTASKFTRLSTLPDYLVIQLKKFTIGEDWTPKKLDVTVDMPFDLDLSVLRGHGLQPGEKELPDEVSKAKEPTVDEEVVAQLVEMGFQTNASRRAVITTGNTGSEAAMEWIMQHLDDPTLNDPLEIDKSSKPFIADPDALANVMSMGFTKEQAVKALQSTDNNIERAIDWIFSHPDEINSISSPSNGNEGPSQTSPAPPNVTDGGGKYQLVGFVSHMGSSSMVGHYVCHILKGDQECLDIVEVIVPVLQEHLSSFSMVSLLNNVADVKQRFHTTCCVHKFSYLLVTTPNSLKYNPMQKPP
ncbi:unnamed protein product [Allacma fusca]|uniref:Ubiquitin carboxyl-terminal hydrolase n=1 Tax=Allacma fusca TaxID=39272 RepID=A0A8J2P2J1_9HEXA|nr:unnamed protein product [Allacma fusca]